ncbi:MAG: FKBP-type peptidyl-prolyl cis-trans isomerase [Ferruginibacter sp.]
MRKKFFIMLALPLVLAACKKTSKCPYTTPTVVANAAEVANLKATLDANAVVYTQHPSGIFYQVITQGSGAAPAVCNDVTVKYSGRIISSATPFDSNATGVTFALGELITGWQIGIPLVQKGGKIILYIPPSLGYGSAGSGAAIPPNSNLVFDIELLNVQ